MTTSNNEAEIASQHAIDKVISAVNAGKCFRFEAGAGAGKTYSLIKCLNYIIAEKRLLLLRHCQQIACITYTNIAKDQILQRTGNDPIVFVETIHAFCWNLIKPFQKIMRELISSISEKWQQRISENNIIAQKIIYNLGHPYISADEISLHHDDVIFLAANIFKEPKFRTILKGKFPYIFIDEYQDTNDKFAKVIVDEYIQRETGIVIGFFGDHWQKIYGDGCGLINASADKLEIINKEANFRSEPLIVNCLNRMRPELQQHPASRGSGSVKVYLTNSWRGQRRKGSHWAGDLPQDEMEHDVDSLITKALDNGWNLSPEKTKILMLTNKVLAEKQGYGSIARNFTYSESYLKKENSYIKFFLDTIEPICEAFQNGKHGLMFSIFNQGGLPRTFAKSKSEKKTWANEISEFITKRTTITIGDAITFLQSHRFLTLSYDISEIEQKIKQQNASEISRDFQEIINLRKISYSEIICLKKYIDDKTPFSTKHGVKGAEYDNVLAVFGRGWNQYDWNKMLENVHCNSRDKDFFERNRNLFYVVCSRPKKNLILLFTQELSDSAKQTLFQWFGEANVSELSL